MDEGLRARLTEWISTKAQRRVQVQFFPESTQAEGKM